MGEALRSFVSSAVEAGQALPVLRGVGWGAEVGLEQPGELRCLLQGTDTELSFRFSFFPLSIAVSLEKISSALLKSSRVLESWQLADDFIGGCLQRNVFRDDAPGRVCARE